MTTVLPTTRQALDPEVALARLLGRLHPLRPEEVPLGDALDRVLARPLRASIPVPRFDCSAMDGYAVRAADVTVGARLNVLAEVRAGQPAAVPVTPGATVRVMTGAPLPPGADAVVPWELTGTPETGGSPVGELHDDVPAWVEVHDAPRPRQHVRRSGEDLDADDLLAAAGDVVGPAEIALAAATGRDTLWVTRAPVVAVLSTGDEVVAPGSHLRGARVPDVNGPVLEALVRRAGGVPLRLPLVADDPEALQQALDALSGRVDLVLTSGGASGGAADLVARLDGGRHPVEAVSLRMKPGKPAVLGVLDLEPGPGGGPVGFVGLPGNPVAAMVAFEMLAVPAIALLGERSGVAHEVEATAAERLPGADGRVSLVRVRLERIDDGRWQATPTGGERAHGVRSLVGANGLAVVRNVGGVAVGESVTVRRTNWSGARAV
ncbi:molybdopterin molybdotransferase MoeA [Phycicoccus jejuensis]|uniref:molybdopterin molybdotransferase MoeA n=1 Tax=Phycicoccus jejuensis TaxID=367299 RepID=UPI00384BB743